MSDPQIISIYFAPAPECSLRREPKGLNMNMCICLSAYVIAATMVTFPDCISAPTRCHRGEPEADSV